MQRFEARWSPAALQAHLEAGQAVDEIVALAFEEIGKRIGASGQTDEYAIQQFLLEQFGSNGLVSNSTRPIVAVNRNSANPHYEVSAKRSSPIRAGDFVLLDVWAKQKKRDAVFYDVTWVGFVGDHPPKKIQQVFEVVKAARDRAVETVESAVRESRTLRGWQVDQAARAVITNSGFGESILHRTGHSIGESVHGNGANMDDLETHDDREIIPFTGFSIEPGIYLPEFGVRSEVNVFVGEGEARVTGAVQKELVRIPIPSSE